MNPEIDKQPAEAGAGASEAAAAATEVAPAVRPPRLQRWLGVRRRPGKRVPFAFTVKGYVLLILVVFGIGGGAFAEYSMKPDFCRSCHLMEPYYQAWHSSSHKGVACTDCHFEPGLMATIKGKWEASSQAIKYVTETYGSKPHAQVSDVSCMRSGCHEKRLLEGKVNWTVKSVTGHPVTIKYDHKPHLEHEMRGKQLRCVSCHSQIVHNQKQVVTLETCFTCHFKGFEHGRNPTVIAGCKGCHDAPKDKIRLATGEFDHNAYVGRGVTCDNCHSDSIKGEGEVPRQLCWNCHNRPEQVARYSDSKFIHEQHISEHKIECSTCHIQIQHNLNADAIATKDHMSLDAGKCAQCHSATHGGPAQLYRGTGGRGVPDMPSPMSRAQVDCIACHKTRLNAPSAASVVGQTYKAIGETCGYCHESKYDGTLDKWRSDLAVALERSEAAYAYAKAAAGRARLDPQGQLKADRLLDDAGHNIRLVKLGHAVHNPNYATALLSAAAAWSGDVAELSGSPMPKPATTMPVAMGGKR